MFHTFLWLLPLSWDINAFIAMLNKEKCFLHNLQLALVESIDFDTQEKTLVSVNQAFAKKGILGIILISSIKHRSV